MNAAVGQRGTPTSSNDGYHFKSTGHYISGFQEMLKMQRNGKLCDIVITVGGEVYRAHKLVFASASKYFSDLFDDEEGKVEIHIDDISPTALRSILSFFYTGEIMITVSNVEDLLLASKKFKIAKLETACGESMPKLLNPTTWIRIKAIAGALRSEELYQKCHSYAREHFADIVKTEKFLQLPFNEVRELIEDNELVVPTDEVVYSAILTWVKFDLPNREHNLYQLMKHVKLPLLEKPYFMKNVAREPLMRNNLECTTLLLEATEYHSGMHCDEASLRIQPRKHFKGKIPYIFVTGGESHNSATSECEMYNPKTNTWHSFSSMKNRRYGHGLVGFKSLLYAFGGSNQGALSSVEYYEPLKNCWTMTTSLSKGRYGHGVCSIDDSIYICGGVTNTYLNSVDNLYFFGGVTNTGSNSVDKFDPSTGVYLTAQPMKNARAYFNLAVSDNCIYAIGGFDGRQPLKSMEVFDPREGKWSNGPSMIKPRQNHGVAVSDGYIYVSPTGSRVPGLAEYWERFDIRGNWWEQLGVCLPMDQLHEDGCCYLLGSSINLLQKFNHKKILLLQMPPMLNNRQQSLSATIMECFEMNHS